MKGGGGDFSGGSGSDGVVELEAPQALLPFGDG